MAELKKGQRLACIPCGRQVVVDCCGTSETTLWCCDRPMKPKSKVAAKKTSKK